MHLKNYLTIPLVAGLTAFHADTRAEWPVKNFQAVAREPRAEEIRKSGDPLVDTYAAIAGLITRPEGNERQAEPVNASGGLWLNEIGAYYRRAGHKSPALGPVIKVNGIDTYRVYIFPYPGSRTRDGHNASASYEANTCQANGKIPWLSVNYDLGSGDLEDSKYWGLAHELMHAMQYGAPLMDDCSHDPFWISEGIADGAAAYLVDRKFPGHNGRINLSNSAVGLRSYRLPLFYSSGEDPKSSIDLASGYGSSSLWRFIAERFGGLKVFPHFLNRVNKKNSSPGLQLKWMDERLQTLPGLSPPPTPTRPRRNTEPPGLYEVFPAFITEFASYGGTRYTGFDWRTFRSEKQARTAWLRRALGGCEEITLTPEEKSHKIPIGISEVSAICISIKYEGFSGNINSKIEVLAESLGQVDQLHLGWVWKIGPGVHENCYQKRKDLNSKWPPCILKAFTQTGPSAGRYARTWPSEDLDFGASGGESAERIYVLSNVAVKPWRTAAIIDFSFRVSVSVSTMNGEPAEPNAELLPPNFAANTFGPSMSIGKEALYGLRTAPPAPETGLKGLALTPYTPNRSEGVNAKVGGYSVTLHNVEYGKTGSVTGFVILNPSDSGTNSGALISSQVCEDGATRPIGEVIQSDEDALRISLDTDLCQFDVSTIQQCEIACPVVDHLKAEVNVAFGWRQFGQTAPTDIRTPGVQRYIDTMPDSLSEAMNFGANTAIPDFDNPSEAGGSGEGSSAGSGSSGWTSADCDCSCEAKTAFEKRGQEVKKAGDNQATMALARQMMACLSPCGREWAICDLEAAKVEKQRQKLLREQAAQAIDCDCSCAGVNERIARMQGWEKRMTTGASIPIEELTQVAECAKRCEQEMIACLTQ